MINPVWDFNDLILNYLIKCAFNSLHSILSKKSRPVKAHFVHDAFVI